MRPRSRILPAGPVLWLALGMLSGCGESGAPDDDTLAGRPPEIARIVSATEAIAGAYIPALDPVTMNDAEIRKVLGKAIRCEFRYTSTGRPVLSMKALPNGGAGEGVIKLNGHLVVLTPQSADGGVVLSADGIRFTVVAGSGASGRAANAIFEIDDELKVGYRGYYRCTG